MTRLFKGLKQVVRLTSLYTGSEEAFLKRFSGLYYYVSANEAKLITDFHKPYIISGLHYCSALLIKENGLPRIFCHARLHNENDEKDVERGFESIKKAIAEYAKFTSGEVEIIIGARFDDPDSTNYQLAKKTFSLCQEATISACRAHGIKCDDKAQLYELSSSLIGVDKRGILLGKFDLVKLLNSQTEINVNL